MLIGGEYSPFVYNIILLLGKFMAENAIIEQTKTFIGRLSAIQKIIIAVVVGAVILSLAIFLATRETIEYGVLYNNLEPQDASQIIESLKTKEVEYKLEDNGGTILVDKTKLYDSRITLAGEGLPAESSVGYELFDKTNLGMSEYVQKLNFSRALEGELARTIGTLDEVKKVRVHIVIPEKTLFKKDEKTPTASITLHLKSGRSISKISIEGIQTLVSSSVEGLTLDKVTIVDSHGKVLSEAPMDNNTVVGMTSTQHDIQRKVEQHYAEKVQSLLDGVLGAENAKVRVNAELDFTQIEKTITDFDPERQVIRSEQNIQEVSESHDSLSYPAVNQAKNSSNLIQNYEITKSVEHIVEATGNVKRLTVSALINGTTRILDKEGIKSLQYTPRPKEELEQLSIAVKNSVGYDPSRNDQISVLNVPFDNSILEEEIKETQPVLWYKDKENLKLIGLLFAMILTIILMYSMLQSRYVKDRLRLALGLPNPKLLTMAPIEDDEDEEEVEEELDDLSLDEDDLLLLPAELPEQLLLEGESYDEEMEGDESDDEDQISLSDRARAALEEVDAPEMTEETLMKLEIKDKVQTFMDDQTDDAIRLVRLLLAQDLDAGNFR